MRAKKCTDHPEKLGPRFPPFKVTPGHRNRHESTGYLRVPISGPLVTEYDQMCDQAVHCNTTYARTRQKPLLKSRCGICAWLDVICARLCFRSFSLLTGQPYFGEVKLTLFRNRSRESPNICLDSLLLQFLPLSVCVYNFDPLLQITTLRCHTYGLHQFHTVQ